jgi:hypothetical protein
LAQARPHQATDFSFLPSAGSCAMLLRAY